MPKVMKRIWHNQLWVITIGIILLVLFSGFFILFPGTRMVIVSGDSMYPTYRDGDELLTFSPKSADDLKGNPVCWVQLADGHNVIKRLIGCPGQTVHLVDGVTYVDGQLIMECTTNSYDNVIIMLGTDEYYFLGDNREDSFDSRMWDPPTLQMSAIKGVVPNSGLN